MHLLICCLSDPEKLFGSQKPLGSLGLRGTCIRNLCLRVQHGSIRRSQRSCWKISRHHDRALAQQSPAPGQLSARSGSHPGRDCDRPRQQRREQSVAPTGRRASSVSTVFGSGGLRWDECSNGQALRKPWSAISGKTSNVGWNSKII